MKRRATTERRRGSTSKPRGAGRTRGSKGRTLKEAAISRHSGAMGEPGAQQAVTLPSSDTGGSTPSAPIPPERIEKAFSILNVRALPVEGQAFSLVVVDHGTAHGRLYELDPSLFFDIKLMAEFVYIAATKARGVRA